MQENPALVASCSEPRQPAGGSRYWAGRFPLAALHQGVFLEVVGGDQESEDGRSFRDNPVHLSLHG